MNLSSTAEEDCPKDSFFGDNQGQWAQLFSPGYYNINSRQLMHHVEGDK